MCRWIVYLAADASEPRKLSDVLTRPSHSLISQSFDASFHPGFSQRNNAALNADGFGVLWYARDGRCFVFKATTPAWSEPNLADLAEFVESRVIFGHVRAASPGSVVSLDNTHPFKRGRLAMMHNGHIERFADVRRALLARLTDDAFRGIRGLTDSEHCFALLQTALSDPGRAAPFAAAELAAAVVEMIAGVLDLLARAGVAGGFTSLNVAVTDGETVVATRFCDKWPAIPPPSLYFSFPTNAEVAAELGGGGGGGAGAAPGDGSAAAAAAGAGAGCGGAAAEPVGGDDHARRAARWVRDEAFLATAAPTAAARALLVASEPAGGFSWLAMPANSMLVYTRGGGPPALSRLEDALRKDGACGGGAGAAP
jgi:glutamine amidotransferase